MISKTVIILLTVLALVYVCLGLVLYLRQDEMVYYPTNQNFDACKDFADAQKLDLDGTRAYFKQNSDTLVIFYHGNAGSACDRTYIKKIIEKAGHSYLIVEYAGYSADTKNPSKKLLFQDAGNVVRFVGKKDFRRVLLIGESLGTAIVAHHANVGKYDAMFLISPFDLLSSVAQSAFPLYPAKWLLRDNYDNIAMLSGKENIWIVHGTADKVIPIKHSKELFGTFQGKNNRYFEIQQAGHNDIMSFNQTIEIINKFLTH